MRHICNIFALFVLALESVAGPVPEVAGAELTGASRVISGDTLEVAGRRIWLYGLDAPELGQRFRLASGRSYDCGHVAATALTNLTVAVTVTSGLGEEIVVRSRNFDMAGVLATIIVITSFGVVMMRGAQLLEHRYAAWRGVE